VMDRVAIDLANRARAESPLGQVAVEGRYGELSLGFVPEIARAEAQRCLRCDVVTSCQLIQVKRTVSV
ncbi:MAG: hypothetical protein WB682_01505, partial [Candidatus Dormiibacterota bacterium]